MEGWEGGGGGREREYVNTLYITEMEGWEGGGVEEDGEEEEWWGGREKEEGERKGEGGWGERKGICQ